MKITFQGKSDEYEIEKSYFYNRAFIVKDKIPNRDKIDFITDSVRLLEFSDHSFEFDEILKCLYDENEENTIIVEEIFTTSQIKQDEEPRNPPLEIKIDEAPKNNIRFTPFNTFSRIFNKDCFIFTSDNCEQKESVKVEKNQKLNIFELLKIEDLDASNDSLAPISTSSKGSFKTFLSIRSKKCFAKRVPKRFPTLTAVKKSPFLPILTAFL